MSLLMVGTPLGIVLGYAMTMFIIRSDIKWQIALIIQSSLFAIFTVICIFLPNIYFSASLKCVNLPDYFAENAKKEEEKKNKLKTNNFNAAKMNSDKKEIEIEDDTISLFQHKKETGSKIKNFFRDLCVMIKVKVIIIKKNISLTNLGLYNLRLFYFNLTVY